MGFTHWDWDLATGNGMNNYKMGMGILFFSGLCSNILKQKNNKYLLTEWEGRTGKYLARGQGVRTERSEFRTS